MKALQFHVNVPKFIAAKGLGKLVEEYRRMIAVNLDKARHRAMKTMVSFI